MTRARGPSVGVLNRVPWTTEEDTLLRKYIEANGVERWSALPHKAGLMRSGKSCRLRWMNHLRPNVKRGHISPDEEDLIIRLHNLLGNRWSLIAGRVPGRTDNEIKNYWNTHLSKKLAAKSFAPRKTVTEIVEGQPLSSVDHHKRKAKEKINSYDDHRLKSSSKTQTTINTVVTDNLWCSYSPVSPTDSTAIHLQQKRDYLLALPDSQLVDATVKCSVTEREKTDPVILEDGYNFYRAENELRSSAGNMEQDMANILSITPFEQSISTTALCLESFIPSSTWFDNIF